MSDDREPHRLWNPTRLRRSLPADRAAPTIEALLARRRAGPGRWASRTGRHRWVTLITVAVSAAGIALVGSRLAHDPSNPLTPASFVTGPNERVTATLGDGTVIRLAPESRLRVNPNPTSRVVWLEGRAFFAVAKHRFPFVVRTNAGEAVALGTRFELVARATDELELLVTEGRVALAGGGKRVEVAAGEFGMIKGRDSLVVSRPADVQPRLAWMGTFVVFQATPLGEAAGELARLYGTPIRIQDSTLARETVTGSFTNESLADVLKVICRAVEARCGGDAAGVTIGQ